MSDERDREYDNFGKDEVRMRELARVKAAFALTEGAAQRKEVACTCHPDDSPTPCQRKYATHHCWRSAVYDETRAALIELKNRDRSPVEEKILDYLKRVERALDGTF